MAHTSVEIVPRRAKTHKLAKNTTAKENTRAVSLASWGSSAVGLLLQLLSSFVAGTIEQGIAMCSVGVCPSTLKEKYLAQNDVIHLWRCHKGKSRADRDMKKGQHKLPLA